MVVQSTTLWNRTFVLSLEEDVCEYTCPPFLFNLTEGAVLWWKVGASAVKVHRDVGDCENPTDRLQCQIYFSGISALCFLSPEGSENVIGLISDHLVLSLACQRLILLNVRARALVGLLSLLPSDPETLPITDSLLDSCKFRPVSKGAFGAVPHWFCPTASLLSYPFPFW